MALRGRSRFRPGSPGPRSLLARLRGEEGFSLVELMIASIVLLTVGAPIVAVLVASQQLGNKALNQGSADALAAAKIEIIRAMPYDNIGFPGGNPPGTIATSNTLFYGPSTLNGQAINISYQISYVDDHGAKTQTYADYKRVVVTVTRTSDSKVLATKTTDVAALTGAADGGAEYLTIRRLLVDMATGNPALSNVTVNIANGPSPARTDVTNSSGSVIFPQLDPNGSSTNFYDVTATYAGYSTYPADLPYSGTGSPAISLEHINHQTGYDDLQTIHMYKNGSTVTVTVYKSDGVTPFPAATTVYMGAGLAGNSATATVGSPTSAIINSLLLGNSYVSPSVSSINIFPGNYAFSGESGTVSSMTYAQPQLTVAVPNNYPTDLTKTVKLVMYANPVTTNSNTTLTVTVKRGTSTIQNAHVEVSSTATGVTQAPSVYVWGNTNSSGQVTLIVPRGNNYTIKATDARGSTASLTSQSLSSATTSATVTITP